MTVDSPMPTSMGAQGTEAKPPRPEATLQRSKTRDWTETAEVVQATQHIEQTPVEIESREFSTRMSPPSGWPKAERGRSEGGAAEPTVGRTIQVTIGRIEVRMVTATRPQPAARMAQDPSRLSLDDYLRGRARTNA
jgi:hypothetical protein